MANRDEDSEKLEMLRRKYMGILKKNPNCVWAKNELRYLGVKNLSPYPVIIGSGAYAADFAYHGTDLDSRGRADQ